MKPGILINLYEDEKILLVIRRHWLAFLQSIFITFILLLIFTIGFFILNSKINSVATAQYLASPFISDNLGKGAFIIFNSIYLLSVCAFFYISWLDYYLDVFMITNKRILRIEQLVLFGQNISETSLQHIQDVSSRVRGIVYTILNVGTIFIETAGERANFTFNFIKDPGEIAAHILELQKEMWGDEGFKGDLTLERKNEKIESMNVGDPLRKKEEKAKMEEEINPASLKLRGAGKLRNEEINPSGILGTSKSINQILKKEQFALLKKLFQLVTKIKEAIGQKIIKAQGKNREEIKKLEIKEINYYQDGRKITPHGVIWQAEQEITEEILEILNGMNEKVP